MTFWVVCTVIFKFRNSALLFNDIIHRMGCEIAPKLRRGRRKSEKERGDDYRKRIFKRQLIAVMAF